MDSQGDNNLGIDDIYEDFEDFDLGNIVDKYKKENEELREHAQSQEMNIQKLVMALEEMQKVNESLTQNISTLFKTAKSELERKEGIIADLRTQRDNTAFRRRDSQFQTFTNNNVKNEVINNNVKNEATISNVKKEVIDTNVKKGALLDVDSPSVYSEGEISDEDVQDIKTDDSDERAFSDKYNNKQTRENWRQDGREQIRPNWNHQDSFRDRHNNNEPKNRYNMFQRRYNNDREQDYRKHNGKFDTNKENDTRRPKERDLRHYKDLDTRRHKEIDIRRPVDREDTQTDEFREIDTRRPKSREYTHRDNFQELDTRRHKEIDTRKPKDREDFLKIDTRKHKKPTDREDTHQEIDARRPKDREDLHIENFSTRGVRSERDKSNHRRTEDRLDRRKNEETKRGLIRHNPRRDSSSYLSPTRRRHKSESDRTSKNTEETPQESKTNTKKMLNIVNKLEKQNRSHTPPLELLPKEENEFEIIPIKKEQNKDVPSRTEPVKNFFAVHLDNILESIQSNVQDKISNSNQKTHNTTLKLETIFSDENFSQEEDEISERCKVKNTRRRTVNELFVDLFDDSQHQIDDNNKDSKEEETNKMKSKKKHKNKSKLDVFEEKLKQAAMSKFTGDGDNDNKIEKKSKEKGSFEAVESCSKNEKAIKKIQELKENRTNLPVSASIEKGRDYDVEFASPLKRYIKKCQELSEEGARVEINTDDKLKSQKQRNSNDTADQEKRKIKKKRTSKELEDIEGIPPNSKEEADIIKEEHIDETKIKRKRKSDDIDGHPHQMMKKSKLLKIKSPRKSFSPLEDIYNEEDAREIQTKKNRRFKQTNTNLQHPKELASSVVTDKYSKSTNSKQKLRSKSVEDRTDNEIQHSEIETKTSSRLTLGSLPEDMHNKEPTEETTKKHISDANNITNDLNYCLDENVTNEDLKNKKKRRSKSLEDNLDNPELKSPKIDLLVVSKDDKNYNERITKTIRRSKDILDDSFEKNSTFAVVRKRKDSVNDGKCQKESPIKSFTAEEIDNSILHNSTEINICQNDVSIKMTVDVRDNTRELDEIGKEQEQNVSNDNQAQILEERLDKESNSRGPDKDAFTKKDQKDSNEIQVQKLEERLVPKKNNSPRKLDKESFPKTDKIQIQNDSNDIQVRNLEDGMVPKQKRSPKGLDKDDFTNVDKNHTQNDSNEIQVQNLEKRIVPKKKRSPRRLDKEASTKIDKDQTQNESNEIQVQNMEVSKQKRSPRGLDKEDFTKNGKNQTQNVSNDIQVRDLEDGIVPKQKRSPRGLDKEDFAKKDKNQTQNNSNEVEVQKLEERIVPKKKNSPRKLDKQYFTNTDKNQTQSESNDIQVQYLEDEIVPKQNRSPRGLDKEASTKKDNNQTQNDSNEIQGKNLEERIEPKQKRSPRGLDKEASTKINKDQTQNVSNEIQAQKPEERIIPKSKNSPRGLDKLLEEAICKNSPKTNDTSKTNNKPEAETDSIASSEESVKNISPKENLESDKDQKKIVIVSDILIHSGKPKEQTSKNNNDNDQPSLPVRLDLPNLIKLDTILKETKENSTLEKETKIDLPNINSKLKTSKSRKDRLLERYASEESQSKLNSTFSESFTDQNEEVSLTTTATCISEIKTKNLEEKLNNIKKRKNPEEAQAMSVTVPKKRKVVFKSIEIGEEIDKEQQIDEIELTLQLMHKDSKIANNTEKKEELKEQHDKINKAKPISLRKRRSKGIAAVRKSPRNLNPKTPELQNSSSKEISIVKEPNESVFEAELGTSVKNTEDEIEHTFSKPVLAEINSGPEDLSMNSNKTEIDKTNGSAIQQLDISNISTDIKVATEEKINANTPEKQKNAHHLPPPLGNIPVTSTSSPIGHLSKARKRITPTPVKDPPVCSFQNILEKNKSEFKIFSKNFILESDLNLTDEGEIPILHLEENHFNNMEDATQKTFDKSIMNLLDCMNVSNLDCDMSKINEKVEVPAPSNSLSFENVIDKAANDIHSTPVKDQSIPVSSTPKVDTKEQTTPTVQPPVRFRRRCRIVAVRKL